jgi:glycosyltransferase involved in cell wall biosynthesis
VLAGWEAPPYWQLLWLARVKGCPVIGFYESTLASNRFKRGLIAAARRCFFRQLDLVVVPGTAARDALLAFGVDESRIVEGFNAVDVLAMHRAATEARKLLAAGDPTSRNLIYVGQLIPRKNLDSLIFALSSLDPAYTLTIVGEGPSKDRLRQLVVDLGLSDRITFRDYTDNQALPNLLCQHSTLVLPSTEEVWGLVVNEALACGLHVVVSAACGVAPSVKGMPGVWLSGTNSAELAQQIEKSSENWRGPIASPEILRHTPEALAGKFLQAARSAVVRHGGSSAYVPSL